MQYNLSYDCVTVGMEHLENFDMINNVGQISFFRNDSTTECLRLDLKEYGKPRDVVLGCFLKRWFEESKSKELPPFTYVFELQGHPEMFSIVMSQTPLGPMLVKTVDSKLAGVGDDQLVAAGA